MPRGSPIGKTLYNNSTVTPLSGGATYTGEWVLAEDYRSVVCAAKSDVSGTMYLDFIYAADKTIPAGGDTPDSSLPYAVEGGITEPPHQLTVSRGWFRVRYINGSSAQTTFQVVSTLGDHGPIVAPANLSMAQNSDASVTRVIEEQFDIAQSKRRGHEIIAKFGESADVDAAGDVIWEGNGPYTGFPTTSENFEVLSSSIQDVNTSGSGAWSVRLYYLDTNYEAQTVDVNLNGQTGVDSGVAGRRCYRVKVLTSASSNTAFNAGVITVRHITTTANIFSAMLAGRNQSGVGAYTIPAGFTGYIKDYGFEMAKTASASASVALYIKDFGASPRIVHPNTITEASPVKNAFYGYLPVPEKSDIALYVLTISTSNIAFTGDFTVRLVKN
jgi:hypothetical protein